MAPSVLIVVLAAAALHAAWNALVKSGTDRYLDIVSLLAGAGLLTLLWLPFLPLPDRSCWPFLVASAVVHQLYFALVAQSYRCGEMSIVYPLTRGAAPAITAIAAGVLLAERQSAASIAGVLLVCTGVMMLALGKSAAGAIKRAPITLALANALVVALYTLIDGTGVRLSANALSYTSWGFLLSAFLFVPTAVVLRRAAVLDHLKARWRIGLIGGACSIAAYTLVLWAMTRAPIPVVAALREISIVFGFGIAVVLLKERVNPVRICAVIIVVAGAIVLKLA